MLQEKWLPYKTIEISDLGRTRYKHTKYECQQYDDGKGYKYILIWSKNRWKAHHEFVHRIIGYTFLKLSYKKNYVIHHKNFLPYDNRLTNLIWVSKEDHCQLHK